MLMQSFINWPLLLCFFVIFLHIFDLFDVLVNFIDFFFKSLVEEHSPVLEQSWNQVIVLFASLFCQLFYL